MIKEVYLIKRYNYILFGESETSYWWSTDYGEWSINLDRSCQFNTYGETLTVLTELLRNKEAKCIQIDKVFIWESEN